MVQIDFVRFLNEHGSNAAVLCAKQNRAQYTTFMQRLTANEEAVSTENKFRRSFIVYHLDLLYIYCIPFCISEELTYVSVLSP